VSRRSPPVSRHYIETSAAKKRFGVIRRAFAEFLALPTAIFVGAIALAFITLGLDRAEVPILQAGRQILLDHIFRSEQNTHDFLATVLTGLITLISITFSILLLAVQQTASSLSNQVYDQFLRRTANQVFLGYAVGLTVYTLIVLASTGKDFNPVFSACIIVAFSAAGLALLIVLIYGTIYQMRPVVIVEAMRDHILRARIRHRQTVDRTRARSRSTQEPRAEIRAGTSGFLQDLRVQKLANILDSAGDLEVEILHPIGTYLARDDTIAVIRAPSPEAAEAIVPHMLRALELESDREITLDPAWGIIELESIGWTTVSSAKSTPEPPRLVINALRDIFTRWTNEERRGRDRETQSLPIVYPDDVHAHVLNALATITAGANESLQHVVMIEALRALKSLYEHVPADVKPDVKDVIRRMVPALRPLILTKELENAVRAVAASLRQDGDEVTAEELTAAVEELAKSVGRVLKDAA
jgi:uncharacterized membrane protein